MGRNDLFLAAVPVALVIAIVLWAFAGSQAAAAWVQAIGALLTFAVALYVPYRERRITDDPGLAD